MTRPGGQSQIEEARRFAIKAHGDQRYGSRPYTEHLEAVAALVVDFGEVAQIVAYLHDIVEDTQVELAEIEVRFGSFVADCVSILTDEPGESRKEKKRQTYAKMAEVSGELELALAVKAADRLANLLACLADENTKKLGFYRQEHEAFRRAAFRPGRASDLWLEMDEIYRESLLHAAADF